MGQTFLDPHASATLGTASQILGLKDVPQIKYPDSKCSVSYHIQTKVGNSPLQSVASFLGPFPDLLLRLQDPRKGSFGPTWRKGTVGPRTRAEQTFLAMPAELVPMPSRPDLKGQECASIVRMPTLVRLKPGV